MATSSITANFYCDDAKAANAFVRMLARPVKSVSLGSDVAMAHVFATEDERKESEKNFVQIPSEPQGNLCQRRVA